MYDRKIPLDLTCGISIASEVILSKWKFHILSKIKAGITRPKDMLDAIPDITKRVLHHQLKQLEMYQIINKTIYEEVPLRTEYRLTDDGESVLFILISLNKWGLDFKPKMITICDKYDRENHTPH